MNVRSRIKKLESQIIRNDAFCECFEIYFKKLADEIYNNIPSNEIGAAMPVGNTCDQCGKPISNHTQDFYKSLEMIYG